MNIEELGERNKLIPGWLRFLIVLPFMGIAIYWITTYSGLYAVLAELELDLFGAYYAVITGIVTFFICVIPIFPIFKFVRTYYERNTKHLPSEPSRLKLLETHYPNKFKWVIVSGIISVGTIVFGSYYVITAMMHGSHSNIEMTSLQSPDGPTSTYVTFQGIAHTDFSKGIAEEVSAGREKNTYYVPVLNTSLDRIRKFYCFMEVDELQYNFLYKNGEHMKLTGTLTKNSLPGLVREDFRNMLADDYWVLDLDNTPDKDSEFGYYFIIVGLISGLIFIVLRKRAMKLLN